MMHRQANEAPHLIPLQITSRVRGFGNFGGRAARHSSADGGCDRTPEHHPLHSIDRGWPEVGYYNHPYLKTLALDEMASQGLRFDRFYAAAPVCTSTRGSVLTGRFRLMVTTSARVLERDGTRPRISPRRRKRLLRATLEGVSTVVDSSWTLRSMVFSKTTDGRGLENGSPGRRPGRIPTQRNGRSA